MTLTPEDAEADLIAWRANDESRDERVRRAHHEAGLSINKIYTLTKISRSTIYRILEK
ncbi:helix-turn-helix domain-containing protein [Nocardia sp. NBC_01327]|uniref:helix-turn-helix domain-containing protein n=1 Tax=Nocardia sp. NBC_01327 TaxID=2903593 RepID=UPI002E10E28D|nr:helix-turn-helix domain-containing protein [Nocardia sp. NBC_01327]